MAQIDISANNKSKTSLTTAEKEWKDEAFGLTGYATAAKMKFPRPPDRSPDQGNMCYDPLQPSPTILAGRPGSLLLSE